MLMKMSQYKFVVVVCIFAMGVLSTIPLHQTADAECGFYSMDFCMDAAYMAAMKWNLVSRSCPGSNDAQITRCEEVTEEAEMAGAVAWFVCYHAG